MSTANVSANPESASAKTGSLLTKSMRSLPKSCINRNRIHWTLKISAKV